MPNEGEEARCRILGEEVGRLGGDPVVVQRVIRSVEQKEGRIPGLGSAEDQGCVLDRFGCRVVRVVLVVAIGKVGRSRTPP